MTKKRLDGMTLNNIIVKMRKTVGQTKYRVSNKLTRKVKSLKSKKGTEEMQKKNGRRIDRIMQDIKEIKTIKPDEISKASLTNTLSPIELEQLIMKSESTERALYRLIGHCLMVETVDEIRLKYPDWPTSLPFLLQRLGLQYQAKKTSKDIMQKSALVANSVNDSDSEAGSNSDEPKPKLSKVESQDSDLDSDLDLFYKTDRKVVSSMKRKKPVSKVSTPKPKDTKPLTPKPQDPKPSTPKPKKPKATSISTPSTANDPSSDVSSDDNDFFKPNKSVDSTKKQRTKAQPKTLTPKSKVLKGRKSPAKKSADKKIAMEDEEVPAFSKMQTQFTMSLSSKVLSASAGKKAVKRKSAPIDSNLRRNAIEKTPVSKQKKIIKPETEPRPQLIRETAEVKAPPKIETQNSTPIHPSWAAKKKLKESMAIKPVNNKKIIFD